jgi:glycosyltransferase involved in cell wall biosynthesis
MSASRPARILQVVGNLNRGGTETWLMNVLRQIDRARYRMDFLVHTASPGAYEEETRRLGAGIVTCLRPSRPDVYARDFRRLLGAHGPYDVVHSHVHHYSGFIVRLARQAGIGVRIAHSHSDTSRIQAEANPARRLYYTLTRHWIHRHATQCLAASPAAAAALFGGDWEERRRCALLYCGIDLAPFRAATDPTAVRAELGVPRDAFLVGHVGRFVPVKNHAFLLEVVAALARTAGADAGADDDDDVHAVLVGDGPLRPALAEQAIRLGIAGRVHFAGNRSDVPRVLSALDAFVFPSRYEGLPLALVEAQAAGVPCVISDAIPPEADAIPRLIRRLPLSAPAAAWAAAARGLRAAAAARGRADSWRDLTNTNYDILNSNRNIEDHYARALGRPPAGASVNLP